MSGVVAGFTVVGTVIALGYLLGRTGALGPTAQDVLSRTVFFVATPALLFTTLAGADVRSIFSGALLTNVVSVTVAAGVYVLLAVTWLRRPVPDVTLGALGASYVNAGNLGLPIAVYVLGDTTYAATAMLFQMAVLGPVALSVLDLTTGAGKAAYGLIVPRLFQNPITVASLLGVLVSATEWQVPEMVARPIELVAGIAVPAALLAFGLALCGAPLPGRGDSRRPVWTAVAIKVLLQPLAAFLFARFVLGLEDRPLLAVTVIAALPTAHNVFVFANRYGVGRIVTRETVLISTALSAPVILLLAAVLG